MTHVITKPELKAELSVMETEKLVDRLKSALGVTVSAIVEIAAIVRELEDRGFDLDSLKIGVIDWFRRIAFGQVLPEIFDRYRHKPRLLNKIAALPIPDQEKLCMKCTLPILVVGDGGASEREVDPLEMTSREVSQVFGVGKIRSMAEQRGFIDDQCVKRRNGTQTLETGVEINKKKRTLIIGGVEVSRSQLLGYLSHLDD